MNLNVNTLIEFEQERSSCGFFPPDQSNSFYTIGLGKINLFTDNEHFDLTLESNALNIGDGIFTIDGNGLYRNLLTREGSLLVVNKELDFSNANDVIIDGTIHLVSGSKLILRNNSKLYLTPNSKFTIDELSSILIDNTSSIEVYGEVDVHVSLMDTITSMSNFNIDSSAVVLPQDIDLGDREFSLTDYDTLLRKREINKNTRGEYNTPNGRIGYTWKNGDPNIKSQCLDLECIYGDIILGDFKFSVLGKQETLLSNLQIIQSLHVAKESTLHIATEYNGFEYLKPELYLGVILDNIKSTGSMVIDGTVIVDGNNSSIIIDRLALLTITETGTLYLQNGGRLISTNNDEQVVFIINGTMIIDSIDQLNTFGPNNIQFGENGKLIILNPSDEYKILFSTPNGKFYSELYRIFGAVLDHIEYHISSNTGIKIDQYFEHYNKDMVDWYNGMRIEKAIHEGLIVWEDGAYIELDHDIIPWATLDCTLVDVAKLFKSYASFDTDRLQDVVNRLQYAGCGDIRFRIFNGNMSRVIKLSLKQTVMNSVINTPASTEYVVNVTDEGNLFMKNQVREISDEEIINADSQFSNIVPGDNKFNLG